MTDQAGVEAVRGACILDTTRNTLLLSRVDKAVWLSLALFYIGCGKSAKGSLTIE